VMGHAVGGGQLLVSTSKIQNKLIEKAKSEGADAVLITGIGREIGEESEGFDAEKQVKATFLKYR
jgi:coenzyme F420-reducing hydrogenase delta subunit